MIDLNSHTLLTDRINFLIDDAIQDAQERERPRDYLGASIIGHECERAVQYNLLAVRGEVTRPLFKSQTLRIFDRGNVYEDKCKVWLRAAGAIFEPGRLNPHTGEEEQAGFTWLDGRLRGHCDGIISGWRGGESFAPLALPVLWEHKCLGAKGWKSFRDNKLKKHSSTYYAQVQLYMHFFKLSACLFSCTNADTMEIHHEEVPFNPQAAEFYLGRALRVFNASDAGELVPRCTSDRNLLTCRWCDWREVCW